MNFLSDIIAAKRRRIAADKTIMPLASLRALVARENRAHPHAFAAALRDDQGINLIAEFKRRSPSKGAIKPNASARVTSKIYEYAGAAAISVLTEETYFDGSLEDLRQVRGSTTLPVLRKDFIVDEYQIVESALHGVDAVLLIVAALDDETLIRLRQVAEDEYGMDALFEVHSRDELDRALACGAKIIGVNNRDLRTFGVSVATSYQLASLVPSDVILVSESGLSPPEVQKLHDAGYRGFLVGEALMQAGDPIRLICYFRGQPQPEPNSKWPPLVKVCGITNLEDARAAIAAGADLLGFNFYSQSPRFLAADAAREIIATLRSEARSWTSPVTLVGVFVNEPEESVFGISREVGLDGIQLHGDEEDSYHDHSYLGYWRPFVIKVVRPKGATDLAELSSLTADAFMLDTFDPNAYGGTGVTADWTVARNAAEQLPRMFLAGGLSPENVGEAIKAVQPYGVDVCSSLEVSPGRKDHDRMRQFVAAVRASKLPSKGSTP